MTTYLSVMIVLLAISTLMKIVWLSKGDMPARKPREEAYDVVINFALIVWAAVLLAQAWG